MGRVRALYPVRRAALGLPCAGARPRLRREARAWVPTRAPAPSSLSAPQVYEALLAAGADASIADDEGALPKDAADWLA